ncbi:MAG: hypothetical protein RLP09_17805 [Sandaracinaceae bacterium]
MSTPAPHTPMAFLKGGAAGMFSAACIKALARAGYQPEDFGSYDYVADQISEARLKTDRYNLAKYGDRLGLPPDKPKGRRKRAQDALAKWRAENSGMPPKPTPRDMHLAGSQSGHLTMNSAYQRDRGNPCTSVVDGFEERYAPCMPHHGATSTANSEHHWVYTQECNADGCAALGAEPPPNPPGTWKGVKDPSVGQAPPAANHTYPAGELDADEAARIQNLPRVQEENLAPEGGHPQPGTQKSQAGAGAEGPQPGDAAAAADANGPSGNQAGSAPLWQQEITGETAGDCIDNFRKAAISAMKQHCADNVAKNQADATGGDSNKTPQQYQAELQAQIDAAEASGDSKEAKRLEGNLTSAQNAHCRAEMGARIGTPGERTDARVPPASTPKPPDANPPVNLTPSGHYQ